jgi:tubulin-specific chaperone D
VSLLSADFSRKKTIEELPPSSREYFSFLLNMRTHGSVFTAEYNDQWFVDIIEGYVTSADSGSEDLIRASRAALAEYCEVQSQHLDHVCETLFVVAKRNMKNDRVLVPTLEVMAFLFDVRIMQKSSTKYTFHCDNFVFLC